MSLRTDLLSRLIDALEALIANKDDFEKKFTELLKSYSTQYSSFSIPPKDFKILCNHMYKTIQTTIATLKKKQMMDDDYEKVFKLIFTLVETHPWITTLSERNIKLRNLANHCIQQMTRNSVDYAQKRR